VEILVALASGASATRQNRFSRQSLAQNTTANQPSDFNMARVKDCSGNPFCPGIESLSHRAKRLERKA